MAKLLGAFLQVFSWEPVLKLIKSQEITPCSLVDIGRRYREAYCLHYQSDNVRLAIGLIMEALSSSETSVSIHQFTQCNIPEDNHLHIRRCENLKSHLINSHCKLRLYIFFYVEIL
jgi:hypothetical protein